jgi:hypothetical protein
MRSTAGGGSAFVRLRVMPRMRSRTAHQAAPGECLVDHHDAAQVKDWLLLVFLKPLQARLQLFNAFDVELSEQRDARALTLLGDIKLDRHLTNSLPSLSWNPRGRERERPGARSSEIRV